MYNFLSFIPVSGQSFQHLSSSPVDAIYNVCFPEKRGERMHLWDHMLEYLLFMLRFQGQSTSASLQRMIDSLQKAVGKKYSTWLWLRVLKRTRAASVFLPKSHQTDSAGHNINHSTLTTAPGHKLTVTDQNKSRPTCSVVIPSHTLESWGLSHQTMINALEIIDCLWPPQSRMDVMSFLAIKPLNVLSICLTQDVLRVRAVCPLMFRLVIYTQCTNGENRH